MEQRLEEWRALALRVWRKDRVGDPERPAVNGDGAGCRTTTPTEAAEITRYHSSPILPNDPRCR